MNPTPEQPGQWRPRTAPLGSPAAPVPPFAYPPYPPPVPPRAPDRRRVAMVILAVAAAVALVAVGGTVAYLVGRTGSSTAAAPSKAAVPVISNIPRPDVACQPWSDWDAGKVAADEINSSELFVGYVDGERQEMLVAQVAMLGIQGHRLEYVWACPPRSQWTTAG